MTGLRQVGSASRQPPPRGRPVGRGQGLYHGPAIGIITQRDAGTDKARQVAIGASGSKRGRSSRGWQRLAALALGCAFSLLCLELLVRGAAGASRSRQDRVNRASLAQGGSVRILCVGESTTAGIGAAPEDSYPFQLGEILNARGLPVSVVNAGRNGADSSLILAGLEAELERYRPDVVVAMMGINDARGMAPADSLFAGSRASWPRLKSLRLIPLLGEALARRRAEASSPGGRYLAVESDLHGLYQRVKEARWYTDIYTARAEGRTADVEAAARAALRAHPGIFAVRLSLAEALVKRGRAREAEEVIRADAAVEDPGAAVALRPGEPSDGEALLAGVSRGLVCDPGADRSLLAREYVGKQLENLREARFRLLESYKRRGARRAALRIWPLAAAGSASRPGLL